MIVRGGIATLTSKRSASPFGETRASTIRGSSFAATGRPLSSSQRTLASPHGRALSPWASVAHASQLQGQVISLLPAGRGEVFAQQFAVGAGEITELDRAQHLSPHAVLEKYGGVERLVFAGEARMAEASFGVPPLAGIAPPGSSPEGGTRNRAAVLEKPLAPAIAVRRTIKSRANRVVKRAAPLGDCSPLSSAGAANTITKSATAVATAR